MKHDLSVFTEANKKKMSWDERAALIKEQFPSTEKLNWVRAFDNDLDLFARIIRDILKLDQAQPGRPGPRPSLDYGQATHRLRQFMGQDYAMLPFPEALRVLTGGLSIRKIAAKTGLERNLVYRLLTGKVEPDVYAMTQIARAYDKHPSYFLEYQQLVIISSILRRLEDVPEATTSLYRKLVEEERD
jgi:transcriptional regulator with XRE-family HTH domain